MRPVVLRLLSLSFVFAVLLLASTASAQDGERPTADEFATDLTIGLVNHVDLTPQQTTEVRPILQDHATQMLQLLPEKPSMLSMMRIRGEMNDLTDATNERLVPLLTDVQVEQLEGYWDEQRKAVRGRLGR
ncbi:MAG: hypothetical protein AAF624_07990 [Bacteroidota bacterium]